MESHAEEVKAKWGRTDAYREAVEKMKDKTGKEKENMADSLMELLQITFSGVIAAAPFF